MQAKKNKEYVQIYDEIALEQEKNFLSTGQETFINQQTYIEAFEDRMKMLDKVIGNRINLNILDLGCGTGSYFNFSKKHNLYGIDISKKNQNIAKEKGYRILGQTIDDLLQANVLFDIVILVDVLEHLPNPDNEIGAIHDILIDGGHLLLQVPYRENLSTYLKPDYPFKYVHIWCFDEYSLEILLTRRNHFQLIETGFTAYIGSLPKIFLRNRYHVFSKIIAKIYIYTKKISDTLYIRLSRKLNYPIEIIMLLKKQ